MDTAHFGMMLAQRPAPVRTRQLAHGDRTITFDQYRSAPRHERLAIKNMFFDAMNSAHRERSELSEKIRKDVRAQFAAHFAAIPRFIPGPTRRHKARPNPAWTELRIREEDVIDTLVSQLRPVEATFRFPYEFDQVFYAWEQACETPAEELERRLEGCDWYSCYSDDHSVWSAGDANLRRINELVRHLGPEAELKFNRACPWLNDDGSRKEGP